MRREAREKHAEENAEGLQNRMSNSEQFSVFVSITVGRAAFAGRGRGVGM
jgi:hypothetical protein